MYFFYITLKKYTSVQCSLFTVQLKTFIYWHINKKVKTSVYIFGLQNCGSLESLTLLSLNAISLSKAKTFWTLVNSFQHVRTQFIIRFIHRQVQLVKTITRKENNENAYRRWLISPYQVWADGRRSVERSSLWIWNFWTPFMPSKAANPWRGTLEVPVTNWRNFARSAWSNERNALQNHWICKKII